MKFRLLDTLLLTTFLIGLAIGSIGGCGKAVEDTDQQLDRRQVDTYGNETPQPADASDEAPDADPSDGDEQIGRVEATGGQQ